jgi:hypothetical protein
MIHESRLFHLGFRTTKTIKNKINKLRKKKEFKKYTLSDIIHLALEEYTNKYLKEDIIKKKRIININC